MTRLSDLMRDSNPLTLRPEVSVKRACNEMRKHRATAVLVTDAAGRYSAPSISVGIKTSHG